MNKLLKTAMIVTAGATLAAHAETDIAVTLTTSYAKVAESAGPITGLSLSGITAFNGTGQVEFACVSNRPYAAETADSAIGQLPAGNYVHQLSVFNCWDGTRTRSYRVQIAQPVGSTDIYAYCPCFTVSQPGVNLVDYPDIRNLNGDASKIAASYTATTGLGDQLIANPVTALKLTAVPYVESDGTSGIDTGYRMKPNSRLEVDFALTDKDQSAQGRVFSTFEQETGTGCSLYITSSKTWGAGIGSGTGNNWVSHWVDFPAGSKNYALVDEDRHLIVYDLPNDRLVFATGSETNWTRNTTTAPFTANATYTLGLFARPTTAAAAYTSPSKARIYGVKIYEDGSLVHDFIPCAHDGIAGFRDAVTGDFIYGEQAPLAFTAGGDFKTYESPYVATPAANSAYYIDTGYQATSNTCFELDCALTGTWENGMPAWYLFYGYGTQPFAGFVSGAGFGAYTKDGDWSTTGVVPSENLCPGIRGTFVVDNYNRKSYALVAGITNGTVKTPAQSLERCPSTTISVKIASHFRGNGNFVPMKIYGFKIYEEGVLVRDFVPCAIGPAQDGSAIVGLRDTITGAFATYPAATSANRLSCGGDEFPAAAPYVETLRSASRYIDTGYTVTANTKVALDYEMAAQRTGTDTWYLFYARQSTPVNNFAVFINKNGFGFINAGSTWKQNVGTSLTNNAVNVRRTVILDNPAGLGAILTDGATNATCATAASGTYSGDTLKLASNSNGTDHFASIRIYGCKIWEKENGEYVLKRDYVPAVENGVSGVRDILPGGTFKPGATAGSSITYGGVFTPAVTAAEATVSHGNPTTLTASALGAASYRWLKNGEPIDGATGATLAAAYGGVGVVDSYQAIAVYTIDEATMESDPSAPVTIEGKASATTIIIR